MDEEVAISLALEILRHRVHLAWKARRSKIHSYIVASNALKKTDEFYSRTINVAIDVASITVDKKMSRCNHILYVDIRPIDGAMKVG